MPRSVQLHVMLSQEEMAALRSLASSLGCSVSDAVRLLARAGSASGTGGTSHVLVLDKRTFARYVRAVRSLGNLLNQSAHALNYIAKAVREAGVDALDLQEALEDVSLELSEVQREAEAIRAHAGELTGMPAVFQ